MSDELLVEAEKGRILYNQGMISRREAVEMIMPYINALNKRSEEIAERHNIKSRKTTFVGFVRQRGKLNK